MQSNIFCTGCGKKHSILANFCDVCGQSLKSFEPTKKPINKRESFEPIEIKKGQKIKGSKRNEEEEDNDVIPQDNYDTIPDIENLEYEIRGAEYFQPQKESIGNIFKQAEVGVPISTETEKRGTTNESAEEILNPKFNREIK